MVETKDSAIKLFGTSISLSPERRKPENSGSDLSTAVTGNNYGEKETEKESSPITTQLSHNGQVMKPETPSIEDETTNSNTEKEETDSQKRKTLKKPDKILPCPRCNSMDTKFCYYNNYNVNQPRHFCKACQRYWTAGGTMRSVPIGAGRRKNKNSNSQNYRQITISESFNAKNNGHILSFGMDAANSQKILNRTKSSTVHSLDERMSNKDDCSSGMSSVSVTDNVIGISSPVPCLPGVPWSLPIPPAGFYPMQFYTAPYWTLPTYSPESAILGKHSRDEDGLDREESARRVLMPKTLRIDDPSEAAKSSIWETLGIKNESLSGGGMFKGFQSKFIGKGHVEEKSLAFSANPAATSRSTAFLERS